MNVKEAYKVGFIAKCMSRGIDPEAAAQIIVTKEAGVLDTLGKIFGKTVDTGTKGLATTASAAQKFLPYMLVLPPVVGVGGGYALSKLRDDPDSVDEMRMAEKRRVYEDAIATLRRSLRTKKQR